MANSQVDDYMAKLRDLKSMIFGLEADIILRKVDIGEFLLKLKKSANGSFGDLLRELDFSARVAARYMSLGSSWWRNGALEASGLHKDLPADLEKLEWLAKLSREQLQKCLPHWTLRESTRSQVILNVKKTLDRPLQRSKKSRPAAESLSAEWAKIVRKFIEKVDEHTYEIANSEAKQELLGELEATFAEVQEAVGAVIEDTAAEVDGEAADPMPAGGPAQATTNAVAAEAPTETTTTAPNSQPESVSRAPAPRPHKTHAN